MFFSTLAKHGVEIKLRIVAYDARKVKLSILYLHIVFLGFSPLMVGSIVL